MEACTIKPKVKKKPVKPKPPPKPTQLKRTYDDPEKPEPVVPPTPADTVPSAGSKLSNTNDPQAENNEEPASLNNDGSGGNCDLFKNSKEKGSFFTDFLLKSNKTPGSETAEQATESLLSEGSEGTSESKLHGGEPSTSSEALPDSQPKERGGLFSEIFKKSTRQMDTAQPEDIELPDTELLIKKASTENKQDKGGGLFSKFLKKTLKASGQRGSPDEEAEKEPPLGNDELLESNITKEPDMNSGKNPTDTTAVKAKKRGLAAIFKKSMSTEDLFEESNSGEDKNPFGSCENLLQAATEKTGRLVGIFRKSPRQAPRSISTEDPLSTAKELSTSRDSIGLSAEEDLQSYSDLSVCNNLSDGSSLKKEKKVQFAGMFRRTPKTSEQQNSEDPEASEGGELSRRRTIRKKRRVVSFIIKKTFPQTAQITPQSPDKLPEPNPAEERTVELQPVEMAAYTTGNDSSDTENDELMEWWKIVTGWTEWNETSNIQEGDEEMIVEQAADRVYLGARLFVHLFNQRGATLQQRILELLSVADAADHFHKKTVKAAVGGGVASVAGSVTTITGLILAPFTFGASVIITAVGISVATAGGITSATANITDTVHSSMDRKKVEKMIQGYQEEIKDIRECLEFVQEGMDTLQEWDFEQYSQSAAKKALNHSVKHVMREGGRAGKDLMINTATLINTVQLLGATGGAIKAAQAISVTTGVMSALFLALDVFFLAKDSHELRKGAKTQFAAKIREVCKELQHGLLELNKVKTQLQKTMDGIEVEEYEEIQEVEVEIGDDWKQDPKELEQELEQELDLLEEKLDGKVDEIEGTCESKLEKPPEKSIKAAEEDFKEQPQEDINKDKPPKKLKSKQEKAKKDTATKKIAAKEEKVQEKEDRNRMCDEDRSRERDSKRVKTEKENQKRQEKRLMKPEWKPANVKTHGSKNDGERESKDEGRETDGEGLAMTEDNVTETEEQRELRDWRTEGGEGREQTGIHTGSESKRGRTRGQGGNLMKESHRCQEWRSSTREVGSGSPYRRERPKQDDPRQSGEEERGSARQVERGGGEEEKRRRRGNHYRGHGHRSSSELGDGLYI